MSFGVWWRAFRSYGISARSFLCLSVAMMLGKPEPPYRPIHYTGLVAASSTAVSLYT